MRLSLAIAVYGLTIGIAHSADAAQCNDPAVVNFAKNMFIENIEDGFAASNFLGSLIDGSGQKKPEVNIELSQFREYKRYNHHIKMRYCEATSILKIRNLGQFLATGLFLNGLDPNELEKGVSGASRFTIQLTSDGDQLIGISD